MLQNMMLILPTGYLLLVLAATISSSAQARSYRSPPPSSSSSAQQIEEEQSLAVIPSPNENYQSIYGDDIKRVSSKHDSHLAAPSETAVPVYVSPVLRPERATRASNLFDSSSESSHAPPNYAPPNSPQSTFETVAASIAPRHEEKRTIPRDLKTAASYGHHHHGGYGGHDTSGWLDMGAWTGGKGSFGWYADYPVGGAGKHHHYGYGRK